MTGKVYLVGGGPGDPGLITVKGLNAIKKADVIVYDRLVNKDLLNYRKKDCKLVYVGKKAKHHLKTQEEINEILYKEAKEGKKVVRLKGGDPYVFGRGGEEGEYLYDRDIEFDEIPGITSAIGGLAYAGIPITHRGVATSFHVITGHLQEDSDDLDWESLAKLKGTLVFLMGVGNLKKITKKLMEEGKSKKTKAAIINWGTTPKQKVIEGNLSNIYEKSIKANIKPPSLIVIGEVIELRSKLNFFERKPLFGKNLIVTREEKAARDTIKRFRELGANVLSFPTIKTKRVSPNFKLKKEIDNIDQYSYLVFTSVNGVESFFKELFEMGKDSRILGNLKVAVIGPKTGKALEKYGIKADLIPNKYVSEDLTTLLKRELRKSDNILIPRGQLGRDMLINELREVCNVKEIIVYETLKSESIELNLEVERYSIIFTSSSTFINFINILGDEAQKILMKSEIISIGPITTKTIESKGYTVDIEAKDYTIDGIIESLKQED